MIPTQKNIVEKTTQIRERIPGMSAERAEIKAESTEVGKIGALVGLLLCLGSGMALVIVAVVAEITIPVVLGVGMLGGLGVVVLFFSATMISREAEPMVGKIGELIVKAIHAIRGKE